MSLGDKLRTLREERNLTQIDVADAIIDISNTDLSRYETEERSPHHKILAQLADFYDVSVDYMLGRTELRQIDPLKGLPREIKKIVKEFIEFLHIKYQNKKAPTIR